MATDGVVSREDSTEDIDFVRSDQSYQELNRIPNIHMLNKPSWATDKEVKGIESVDEMEYQKIDVTASIWKSLISIPMIILLALPVLVVLSFTLFRHDAFPASITPHMFYVAESGTPSGMTPFFWAIALCLFIPWSTMVCRFENWVSKHLQPEN